MTLVILLFFTFGPSFTSFIFYIQSLLYFECWLLCFMKNGFLIDSISYVLTTAPHFNHWLNSLLIYDFSKKIVYGSLISCCQCKEDLLVITYNKLVMNLSQLSKHCLSIVCLNVVVPELIIILLLPLSWEPLLRSDFIEGRSCSKVGVEQSVPG